VHDWIYAVSIGVVNDRKFFSDTLYHSTTPETEINKMFWGSAEKEEPSSESSSEIESPAGQEDGEADYDVSPTKLYQAIETKEWDKALNIIEEEEKTKPKFLQSEIWVFRREKMQSDVMRWRMLPLHAALFFMAPFKLIKALVDSNESALKECDDVGMMPLHIAFKNYADDEVIGLLVSKYPLAAGVTDKKNKIPVDYTKSASNPERGVIIRSYSRGLIEAEGKNIAALKREIERMKSEMKVLKAENLKLRRSKSKAVS